MRILRVTGNLYPEQVGGIELHAHQLSKMQAEAGHEVTVVTSDHGDSSLPREEERDGYRVRRHAEVASPLDNTIAPGAAASIRELAGEADVVHAHSHLFFLSNLAAAVTALSDAPLLVTNHGLVSQTAPAWIQRPFDWTVGRFTFAAADRILCYTDTDRERLRERGVDTPVSVVPNGIDCSTFAPTAGEDERDTDGDSDDQSHDHSDGDDVRILFVGRLKEGKGPHDLLEAFAGVLGAHPGAELVVVGTGPMRPELESLATELGVRESVEFAGEVANAALPGYYAGSDVFALPSYSEGLPRTVLEAMGCAVPVVASDLPQLRPVVEGAGVVVQPGHVDELRTAICDLLSRPERRRELGISGRRRVREQYSWEETVARTSEVCRELTGDRVESSVT